MNDSAKILSLASIKCSNEAAKTKNLDISPNQNNFPQTNIQEFIHLLKQS